MKKKFFKELFQIFLEMIGYIALSMLIGLCVFISITLCHTERFDIGLDIGCGVTIILIILGIVKQFLIEIKKES